MKKAVLILFFLISVISVRAMPQIPVSVVGTVTNQEGNPLEGITLFSSCGDQEYEIQTNSDGEYNIRFVTDDPDTNEKEGVEVGESILIVYSGETVSEIIIEDYGSIVNDITIGSDDSNSISSGSSTSGVSGSSGGSDSAENEDADEINENDNKFDDDDTQIDKDDFQNQEVNGELLSSNENMDNILDEESEEDSSSEDMDSLYSDRITLSNTTIIAILMLSIIIFVIYLLKKRGK